MAEADDQYIGDAYRDPMVECGRGVLERLDAVRTSDTVADGVSSVTYIHKTPEVMRPRWEITTVHRAEIIGQIHSDILRQPDPPAYLKETLGSLVVAHVYHENQRYNRSIPLFSPDREELAAHIHALWVMIPDQVRNSAYDSEYSVSVHQIGDTVLELLKGVGQASWSLNFRHEVSRVSMLSINSPAEAWFERPRRARHRKAKNTAA